MAELLDISTEPVIPAQTNAPETEPSGWMPLTDEARNTIPENIKGLFEAKKWSSVEEVATSYSELEKILGKGEHIFKPESMDDADGWKKYYQQLGVPDDVNGYEYEADEVVPFEDELLGQFKEFSKKIHLNKEQSAGLVQFQRDIIKAAMQVEADAQTEQETTNAAEIEINRKALVQKYGGEVNYKNKAVEARTFADNHNIYQALEKRGYASDPEIISFLVDMAELETAANAEGRIFKPDTPLTATKDPLVEMEEIKKSEAFTQRFHPQHKPIMKRFMELNTIIANSGLSPKRIQDG